ncbi:NADH:flavin oxidoreductase/NADH oxidase family protein [Salisediminibacterium selenitireducens]|uniref:NADH:flavin oxidoreductase/NADH oxidase n=1 Tax=Bacillus selenitireducens (strain ATCC 700615 / DSM 15326 / MLS10) TaxID=439292 RepID=D6XUJ3_BACIE|nr:NADH:flavin oxidoreductase/NADH oxidase family protein [Salisediminibacterium selenitireducens]ADH99479.1 NADH:flavin oxidoreductase/NADH oxidase [[Bacillus] selenitireducens MLS10]
MKQNILDQSLTLSSYATSKNRWFKSAMSEAMATANHSPTSDLINLYRIWAEGGSGIVVTGNVMVDPYALGEPKNVVLTKNSDLNRFEKWAKAGTANGTLLLMQLNHPGKQVLKGVVNEAVAPSAVPFPPKFQKFFPPCRALTKKEIWKITDQFAQSARLAQTAGFSGVQIHAAHGYLISQFLSPIHNLRLDEYGGSIQNRFRFLRDICRSVRQATGSSFTISVKINSADFLKSGFTEEESLYVIGELEKEKVDLVEISGGTYEKPAMFDSQIKDSTKRREAYFIDFAEKVSQKVRVPIVLTGGFRTKKVMEEALITGVTDMIGVARPLAIHPDLPAQFSSGFADEVHLPDIKTGFRAIDDAALLELMWYARQLHRHGAGKPVRPGLSAHSTLLYSILKNGTDIFQLRRV